MNEECDWRELQEKSVLEALHAKYSRAFTPKTPNQAIYLKALEEKTVIICTGPSGTGKTYLACGYASRLLRQGQIDKVIISRPLVPCGKGYGFRKGDFMDKVRPDMRPMLDAFQIFFGRSELDRLLKEETIEILPLDDMRGCSLPRTVIICDESQNAELTQLHMLLTRFGEGSKVIVTGDVAGTQTDLKHLGINPLKDVIQRFTPKINPAVCIVKLTREDIVRHPLIQWIDERFTEGPPAPGQCSIICDECGATGWYTEDTVDNIVICHNCQEELEVCSE